MAAAPAGPPANMDELMEQTLGITRVHTRTLLIESGFSTLQALRFKDLAWVQSICSNVRKCSRNTALDRFISMEHQRYLESLVLWVNYFWQTRRESTDYALPNLDVMEHIRQWVDDREKDPTDTISKFADMKDRRRWLESITTYMQMLCGKRSNMPLAYILRDPAAAPGPAPALDDTIDLASDHLQHARMNGTFYASDRKVVFQHLKKWCHGSSAWSAIEQFDATNNGREAWLLLKRQYMGANVQRNLMAKAEQTLQTIRYDGQSRHFTFDKFVDLMRRAHNDLGPQDQMSEARKVRKLLDAFQVSGMQAIKLVVTNDNHLSTNFEACVTYIADNLPDTKKASNPRNVAAVSFSDHPTKSQPSKSKSTPKSSSKNSKSGDKPKATKWEGVGVSYPANVWRDVLTEEQRKQCRDHSAKQREQKAGKKRRGAGSVTRQRPQKKQKISSVDTSKASPALQQLCAPSAKTTQRSSIKAATTQATRRLKTMHASFPITHETKHPLPSRK